MRRLAQFALSCSMHRNHTLGHAVWAACPAILPPMHRHAQFTLLLTTQSTCTQRPAQSRGSCTCGREVQQGSVLVQGKPAMGACSQGQRHVVASGAVTARAAQAAHMLACKPAGQQADGQASSERRSPADGGVVGQAPAVREHLWEGRAGESALHDHNFALAR